VLPNSSTAPMEATDSERNASTMQHLSLSYPVII
jgi:hypothetical protein